MNPRDNITIVDLRNYNVVNSSETLLIAQEDMLPLLANNVDTEWSIIYFSNSHYVELYFLQRFGSISVQRGSVSWDPHLGKVNSDPPFLNSGSGSSDPHLKKVDPGSKWIRNRESIFHIFHVGQITILIFVTAEFRKRHFSDNKNI